METLFEFSIATYLTRGGKVFIAPQFSVSGDRAGSEWSCPDIVALNFENLGRPEVLVVEVATGSNIRGLLEKVRERKTQAMMWPRRDRGRCLPMGILG